MVVVVEDGTDDTAPLLGGVVEDKSRWWLAVLADGRVENGLHSRQFTDARSQNLG